jgi:hypothetical protein
MRIARIVLVIALVAVGPAGCAGGPPRHASSQVPLITLEEAKALLLEGRVETLFQPHQGPVSITLKDGSARCFHQPHLDWVLDFIDRNGLKDVATAIE